MSVQEELLQAYHDLLDSCEEKNLHPGIAIETLLYTYVQKKHYQEVFNFLGELIFSSDREIGRLYISENNMYLYQMLEIYFLEQGNPSVTTNIFDRFGTVDIYKSVCIELRLGIRRIWFRYPSGDWQQKFAEYIYIYPITAEQLAVVAKYSVPKDMLLYVMEQLCHYLTEPMANFLSCYRNGIAESDYTYNEPASFLSICTPCILKETELDASHPISLGDSKLDDKKIAVILCKNDERYAAEVKDYISCMTIPENFSLEFITIKNAASMASGYNYGMNYSNAKYKFYIHQDTFLIQPDVFLQFIYAFSSNKSLGLLGIAGCTKLPSHGKWWDSNYDVKRMALYQDGIMTILHSKSITSNGNWEDADAMDGILLATAYDLPWRDDIFDGWHFYDISQCYEFRKHGYRTGALNPNKLLLLHETTMKKDPQNFYELYRRIFVDLYFK